MTQPDSPAAELRAAAQLLRERAIAAQGEILNAHYVDDLTHGLPGPIGAYAARVHPGVGEALAAWLDREAAIWEALETAKLELHPKGFKLSWGIDTHAEALATARALLGTAR